MSSNRRIVLAGCFMFSVAGLLSGCISVAKGLVGMAGEATLCGVHFVDGATNGRMDLERKWAATLKESLPGIYVSKETTPTPSASDASGPASPSPSYGPSPIRPAQSVSETRVEGRESLRRVEAAYKACNYADAIRLGAGSLRREVFNPAEKRQVLVRMAASYYCLADYANCDECIRNALGISGSPGISVDEYPPSFARRWEALGGVSSR